MKAVAQRSVATQRARASEMGMKLYRLFVTRAIWQQVGDGVDGPREVLSGLRARWEARGRGGGEESHEEVGCVAWS